MNEKEALTSLYTGKRVMLVGGARPTEFLPDADTWVQVNDHVKDNGWPVDVIYHSSCGDIGLPFETAKVVRYNGLGSTAKCIMEYCDEKGIESYPYIKEYIGRKGEWGHIPEERWLGVFMAEHGLNPFSGIIALEEILRYKPEIVFVTGMTLYSNGDCLPERRGDHYIQPHVDYLKKAKERHEVVFDIALEDALALPVRRIDRKATEEYLRKRLKKKELTKPEYSE